ncbi:MAG TPA: Gfo/Idh/MocA family oxidoreductase [Pirellulales bacterium]|nr:Gfo/Idh/MocA family oxidoreductase [Pirellulales bacterium]
MFAPIRFGLIGYGAWGSHHAAAIAQTPDAELVAIAARSEATRQAAATAFPQAGLYGNCRDLLARDDVDVVDVVLPSYLHTEIGRAVLQSGRHLLLEKPMALSLADCDELIALAAQKKQLLAIGHELRLSCLWSKVKQLIDSGGIGTPQYALVELSRRPYRLGADGWRFDVARVGNWILEEPIHFFDLARWYLASAGDPMSVYARANSRQPGHPELQDNFSAIVSFTGGAYAVISQTLSAFEHHQTVKVSGTTGAIWASWSGAIDRTRHPRFWLKHFDGERLAALPLEKPTGEVFELEDEIAMVVDCVRHGAAPAASGHDGRWSVGLCLAAQRSVETGAPVTLEHLVS